MKPAAVVVGLCVHGLAVARSLATEGVKVYALEKSDLTPGAYTKFVQLNRVSDINGPGLIESLIDLGKQMTAQPKPVLILTNDNMVKEVAQAWPQLEPFYQLSWSHCLNVITKLLLKSEIERFSVEKKMNYPRSWLIDKDFELAELAEVKYPIIIKPVKPLSSFKTLKAYSFEELQQLIHTYEQDLPILAQQWIDGGDDHLFFCALYLDKGEVVTSYVGRKLASYPPAMGQTLIATGYENREIERLTKWFFEGLELSGPVSLELKVDDDGEFWVIEPTVGRTDFWADLPIQSGVNLPYLEYCRVTGTAHSDMRERSNVVWFDTEKDRFAYLRECIRHKSLSPHNCKPVLPYYGHGDLLPLGLSLLLSCSRLFRSVMNRFKRTRSA